MSTPRKRGRVRPTYEFIKADRQQYNVQALCRILGVAPSGHCEWLRQPARSLEDSPRGHDVPWNG